MINRTCEINGGVIWRNSSQFLGCCSFIRVHPGTMGYQMPDYPAFIMLGSQSVN
jgi:hypothetical protein